LCCFLCSSVALWAQTTGGLYGKVTDKASEETLIGVVLVLMDGDVQVAATTSDLSGNYNFSTIQAGTYRLVAMYTGYPNLHLKDLTISADQNRNLDLALSETLDVPVVTVGVKLVDPTKPQVTKRDANFIGNNPDRGIINTIASTTGINTPDDGELFSSAGSRTTSNLVMVNGVPMLNSNSIPLADLEVLEVQVMTSGISARYGDATGSITNIITKGPSTRFSGGVQLESSQFLDNFGATTANAFFSGPIIAKPMITAKGDTLKRDGKVVKSSILGYRFSGAYFTTSDNRPSALSTFKLSDEKLAELLDNPLMRSASSEGVVLGADQLTESDLERTNVRSNARNSSANYTAVLEFKPSSDFFLALTSEGQFNWGKEASIANQLFNYQFNPDRRTDNLNVTLRFRHEVSSTQPKYVEAEEGEQSSDLMPVFQNLSYQLTGSYTQRSFSSKDPRYNDFWEYGYVGKFYESRRPVIGVLEEVPIFNSTGDIIGYEERVGHAAFFNSFDRYEPNLDINPGLASYNNLLLQPNDWRNPASFNPDAPGSLNEMQIVNGLINGNRNSVYGLFNAPHITEEGFTKTNSTQIRATVQTNFELYTNQRSGSPMRHKIEVGGVFDQRIDRLYNINPFELWNLAYQSANTHLSNATDLDRPTGETYYDPVTQRSYALYDALIRTDADENRVPMSNFGANLRQSLGLDEYDWVAVHELTPSDMDMGWFAPSTLVTGQQRVLNYYGYDYLGNPSSASTSFNDFFTETDENGVKTRPVAAFQPIYAAGYIQDQFIYKDMVFNIGLRLDSYDANTSVLQDPYSLVGYETAAEFESDQSLYNKGREASYQRPSNIGDDFAVYVSENSPDANVVGYRDGDQWYNASGLPINAPNELGAVLLPALKGFSTSETDPQGENYDPNEAFRDYTPSLIVMPRISFSFPISEQSNFYANYDILSQRPPVGGYASALDYYNFREITANNGRINNASLRPERTINYEVGFQQAVSKFSKLNIALVYKEERDLIQLRQYVGAYPNTYTTLGNDDFSTSKIFKLEYETLRQHGLRIIANYALQFSEGTGSNPTSSAGVAARELKYVFALDFDQRHTFYTNLDYRFQSGDNYFGPMIGNARLLENMGFSVSMNANSGRPYTRKRIAGGIGNSFQDRITEGSVNGARMPWNFRVGIKVDRNFIIGKDSKNPLTANVYLRISNLFNTQNVLDVYAVTGSPTDDGFLTSSDGPGPGFASSQPDSYELLYGLRNNDPFNISRPRRIFLGLSVLF
jgi:hypothetical protein